MTDHAVLSCGVLAPSALHDLTQDASVDVGQLRDVEAYPSRRVLPQPLQQRVVRPFWVNTYSTSFAVRGENETAGISPSAPLAYR